jgi:DNA-directed RNA polymerase subunit RPC12/RpoP
MKRKLRRYKFGYFLGAALFFIGLLIIAVIIWRVLPEMNSSSTPLQAFWDFLWTEELGPILGIRIQFAFLVILAGAVLVLAGAVFAFSSQWFFLPSKSMKLQCPFCKKYWTSTYDSGQVVCPHCRHLIHPKLTIA